MWKIFHNFWIKIERRDLRAIVFSINKGGQSEIPRDVNIAPPTSAQLTNERKMLNPIRVPSHGAVFHCVVKKCHLISLHIITELFIAPDQITYNNLLYWTLHTVQHYTAPNLCSDFRNISADRSATLDKCNIFFSPF